MKIAVKDANILIDLIEADLLGLWFRLGIETYTTDLVRSEIKKASQRRTGDDMLRKAAKAADIEFRGVFWVFDRLIEEKHLSKADACLRLQRLLDCGSFLPRGVCNDRFRAWKA